MERVLEFFQFDSENSEFELLETESGAPRFFGGYQERGVQSGGVSQAAVAAELAQNEERVRRVFYADCNPDILLRRFLLGGSVEALCVCINGMASGRQISEFILKPGMQAGVMDGATDKKARFAVERVFAQQETVLTGDWAQMVLGLLQGQTVLFLEGDAQAIIMDTREYETRGVGQAENEKVVRGPRESFNESIRTNITLLRRIVKTPDFVCEFQDAGARNNISLVLAYRAEVVNPALLREVKRRLSKIDTRMILNDGTVEQLTERRHVFPLPQVLCTERPDRAAAHIMQGHVAVLVEGSPSASIMPATLHTLLSTSEDVYLRKPLSRVLRTVRYLGALLSIVLPGYFLAIALHHPGMLSAEVITAIITSRQMVFLPLAVEVLFLLWVFQLLREAGVRVPGSAGQAIGIIGGLILGQAAVAASMVSTVTLILVALSGLGNFTIPDYSTQIGAGYFRLSLVFAAWMAGLLGFTLAILALAAWTCSVKSYGVPFLSPLAPKTYADHPGIRHGRGAKQQRAPDYTNTQEDTR